jgi:hypothetical protein
VGVIILQLNKKSLIQYFIYAVISFMLFVGIPVGSSNTKGQKSKDELRVLFIGNSLTYSNDLPAIVEALAEAGKQKRFVYKSVSYPDYSLEDQWNRGEAQKLITKDKWDVVVLQQGPSGLEESRKLLIEYTRRFDKVIRAAGAEPALYTVWPSHQRFKDFDRVIESYKLAALDVKGLVFPAGAAWLEAWKRDATLALYAEDRFHPSVMGSYLAALVIYEKLYGQSPVGLPASLKIRSKTLNKIELTKEQANLLQVAATETNKKF